MLHILEVTHPCLACLQKETTKQTEPFALSLKAPAVVPFFLDPIQSHAFFHQSPKALAKQFAPPYSQAQAIIHACPHYNQAPTYYPFAIHPRGTAANQLWQMDVTHVPQFQPQSYLHVTIDTYSGFIWATAHKKETSKHVITHMLHAVSVMGQPLEVKSDNGPCYCSQLFQ